MIRRPPRSTLSSSSAASDVYKRQGINAEYGDDHPSTMGDHVEHTATMNQEARLRKHSPRWADYPGVPVDLLDRFAVDYKGRAADGDAKWSAMLDDDSNAEAIANGLMSALANCGNSTDMAYVVLMMDDLIQDLRSRASLFRGDKLDENIDILLRLLENHAESNAVEADLLNQRLMHLIAVLFYPGLGYGEAVECPHPGLTKFCKICRDRLAYPDTSLRQILHALSALQVLLRHQGIRQDANEQFAFHRHCAQLLNPTSKLLKEHQNNNQLLYQLSFCLWLLSYDPAIAEAIAATDVVHNMLRVMRDVTKEKVLRMCIACFRNLVDKADHNETMIEQGALKQLVVLRNKTWSDEEVVEDLAVVADALAKSVKILSSVDKYRAEVKTGQLDWTPVHKSESFFRENAEKFAPLGKPMIEFDDLILLCNLLRTKVAMQQQELPLSKEDKRTISVICHDLGAVSYTHLRAHETPEHLVCRLLLEKKKKK
eukprot:TRINITY_DN14688_c0_g1_i3.p1 TRINITY_DN14688_c0_g1~~TRINITY_DN14688_c0_g1_i3.p1  ORF type:complete len:485 (+),score=155.99 TRINITY_DN14688_c0_g1_i3:112-1566(+)